MNNPNSLANQVLSNYLNDIRSKTNIQNFRAGDLLSVELKIDGRSFSVTGRCINIHKKDSLDGTFTIFYVVSNTGVRRTFPYYGPVSVKVLEKGKVRRAKLSYFEKLRGKNARIKAL